MNSVHVSIKQALPISFTEVQVTNEDLMIHFSSVMPGLEEMNTVQVGDVHSPKWRDNTHVKKYADQTMYKYKCDIACGGH